MEKMKIDICKESENSKELRVGDDVI